MKRLTTLVSLLIIVALSGCSKSSEDFNKWIREHKGKKFTAELMQELISTYGNPIDSSSGSDVEVRGFDNAFFLGPAFETEEGKRLYQEAEAEWDRLYAYWTEKMNRSGEEQGISSEFYFSDMNNNWSDWVTARDEYYNKYANLYNEKASINSFTLGEFLKAYQKKYPELSMTQCIDSIKSFKFAGVGEMELANIQNKTYSFSVEKSVSYKRTFGKEKEDIKDFEVDLTSELTILGDGTIGDVSYGTSYCITEDSKNDLKKKVIGDWVYKSGGEVVGAFKFNEDGTYRMSNNMFGGMSKEGKWSINCSGEIDATKQNTNLTLTEDGLSVGETTYKKN